MMRLLVQGLVRGAGYGLAVACVETWLLIVRIIAMNLPSFTALPAQAAAIQIGLGAVIGLAVSPLLGARLGALWHLVAVAGVWTGLGALASVRGDFFFMLTVVPPGAGLALGLLGLAVGRWRRPAPYAIGALVLVSALGFAEIRRIRQAQPAPSLASRPAAPSGAPDVVIVVLDTVRAANVSAYGYGRRTSPHFDELARDGALFLDATSPSNWSLPSHASLFTGLFPTAHGAHGENHYLREELPTIGEVLGDAGWETSCFTANAWISDALGTARGFDYADEAWRAGAAGKNISSAFRLLDFVGMGARDKGGADTAGSFERWLAERSPDARPYFAFLNFLEAHFPYHQLPPDFLTAYSTLSRSELREVSMDLFADQFGTSGLDRAAALGPARDMYDGGVLYSDHLLGRVADALRRRGTLDSTVLVVLSDHGELLGEHEAFGHGRSLFEADTRVPLLIRYPPAVPGARVAGSVSTVGVMATVLDLVGLEPPSPVHVGSLLPALAARPAGAPLLAERLSDPDFTGPSAHPLLDRSNRVRAYRAGPLKLFETSRGERMLFDLAADPGETRDVAAARPQELARMVAELETWKAALGLPDIDAPLEASAPLELDAEAEERLRSLGYLE